METEVALGAVALGVPAFLALRRFLAPRPRTERLAITVWAAFGRYATAGEAEDALHLASRAVFGAEAGKHEAWLQGHVANFREAEAAGRLARFQAVMRVGLLVTAYGRAFNEACQSFKVEALNEGQAIVDKLAQQFPQVREPMQATLDVHRQRLSRPRTQQEK